LQLPHVTASCTYRMYVRLLFDVSMRASKASALLNMHCGSLSRMVKPIEGASYVLLFVVHPWKYATEAPSMLI
jgi:hypothetical protein